MYVMQTLRRIFVLYISDIAKNPTTYPGGGGVVRTLFYKNFKLGELLGLSLSFFKKFGIDRTAVVW